MSDIPFLRARLRKRDKDIQQALKHLKLEEGEMADMIRDGFRLKLAERKPAEPLPLTRDAARMIARELTQGGRN